MTSIEGAVGRGHPLMTGKRHMRKTGAYSQLLIQSGAPWCTLHCIRKKRCREGCGRREKKLKHHDPFNTI